MAFPTQPGAGRSGLARLLCLSVCLLDFLLPYAGPSCTLSKRMFLLNPELTLPYDYSCVTRDDINLA